MVIDPAVYQEPSPEQKSRFGIARSALQLQPKVSPLQITTPFPTSVRVPESDPAQGTKIETKCGDEKCTCRKVVPKAEKETEGKAERPKTNRFQTLTFSADLALSEWPKLMVLTSGSFQEGC